MKYTFVLRKDYSHMSSDDQTLGEIARRLDETVSRFEDLTNRLDTTYTRNEMFYAYQKLAEVEHLRFSDGLDLLRARVVEVEEGRKWMHRMVMGTFATAIITVMVSGFLSWKFHS